MMPTDIYGCVLERKRRKPRKENPNLKVSAHSVGKEKKHGETLLGTNVELFRSLYNFILLAIRTQSWWRTGVL